MPGGRTRCTGFLAEDLGVERIQWLPCVALKDFHSTAPGYWDVARMPRIGTPPARPGDPTSVVTPWSVDPDDWGEFLCQTFYLWAKHGIGKVFIHWFESLVGQWMGKPAQICTLAGVCGRSLVTVEKDGSVYSCDQLRFSRVSAGELARAEPSIGGHGVLGPATPLRLPEARGPARVLPAMPFQLRVQRRVPEEPLHQDS